jgi:DeoR/GlpR family transcriptional regulator of sugar metabolism
MFAAERQDRILAELVAHGRVTVTALAAAQGVSEDTVRRDLKVLADRGYLQKTHGGAVALDPARMAWTARSDLHTEGKAAIGAAAAPLVSPGQTIFLDAGSTVQELARQLTTRPLTVITNSLDIAAVFADDRQVQLTVTGGDWQPDGRLLTGSATLAALAARRGDWAFLGACSIDPQVGVTAESDTDAQVKRAMAGAARHTVVLADRTKFGSISPYLVAPITDLYAVVTDDAAAADALRAAGLSRALHAPAE